MSRWFRHYAGMMRDEKLVSAAVRAKQPVERVIWVWGAILESAAEEQNDGRFTLDPDEAAYFLRCSGDDISAVVDALETLGRLHQGAVVRWNERQYISDKSAERVRRHRDKKRVETDVQRRSDVTAHSGNAEVTAADSYETPPETETETETETEQKGLLTQSSGAGEDVSQETNEALTAWNEAAERFSLPKAQRLNATRRRSLTHRLADLGGIEGWRAMIEIIGKSPHLLGDNDRGWKVFFDWVLKSSNLTKVMEGNYVRAKTNRPNSISARFDAIRASIENGSEQRDQDSGEDPFGLPGLRQSA